MLGHERVSRGRRRRQDARESLGRGKRATRLPIVRQRGSTGGVVTRKEWRRVIMGGLAMTLETHPRPALPDPRTRCPGEGAIVAWRGAGAFLDGCSLATRDPPAALRRENHAAS